MGSSSVPEGRLPYRRLSAAYLVYFAALGALFPFWGPYLESLGFGAAEIGEISAVLMAMRIVSPPLTGGIADHPGRAALTVRITSWITFVSFGGVFFGSSYAWLFAVSALFGASFAATMPPQEALTIHWLGDDAQRYGHIRLWGSVGFIISVLSLGALIGTYSVHVVPIVTIGIFFIAALVASMLPHVDMRSRSGEGPRIREVLRKPAVLALLFVTFLQQMGHGPYFTFYSILLEDHGYSPASIAPLWAIGVVAEIGAFLLVTRLFARFSPRALWIAALLLSALRWVLIGAFVDIVVVIVLAQLIHAASYAVFHSVAMRYLGHFFKGANAVRGQALYGALSYGAGGALGSLLSGRLWTAIGPEETFMVAAAAPLLGAIVAWIWVRETPA